MHVPSTGVSCEGTITVINNKLVSLALVREKGDYKVIFIVDLSKRIILSSLAAVAIRVAA